MRPRGLLLPAMAILATCPASASATQVGGSLALASAGTGTVCANCVVVQVQPTPRAIPTDGVITSWRADVGISFPPAGYALAIVVDQGSGVYRLDRLGTGRTGTAAGVQAVADRVTVTAGEYAGMYVPPGASLGLNNYTGPGFLTGLAVAPGGTFSSPLSMGQMLRYEATVEPDADTDGFGDATQDACPAVAARQVAPCVDPSPPAGGAPGPGGGGGPAADTTPPALQNVVVSRGRVLFTVSEAGSVVVRITRLLDGRRRGKACVKPTARLRSAKPCTRRGPTSTTTTTTAAGAGSAGLNTALLRKGAYEVSVLARDAAGNTGKPVVRRLAVKR